MESLPQLHFDQLLDDRIGLGRYQYQAFAFLSFIDFIDGMQEIMMSILMAILTVQWSLSETKAAALGSMYFIGMFFGNIICGLFVDKIGRKTVLVYSMFLTFITVLLMAFADNYAEMTALRFIIGLLFGTSLPNSMVVIGEIVPTRQRGMYIVSLQIVFTIGKLYIIACGFIFLDDFEHGDWQDMMIFNSIPALICFVGSIFVLRESPRYLLQLGQFNESYEGIDEMLRNNKNELLADQEKLQLRNWYAANEYNQKKQKQQNIASIKDILTKQYLRITLSIWSIVILQNIQGVGLFTIIPFIYQDSGNGFLMFLLAIFAELPSVLIFAFFVDNKKAGRIRLTILGFILQTIAWFSIYIFKAPAVAPCMILGRFASRMVYSGTNVLAAESYPTATRSLGVGSAQASGKLFGSISPFLYFPMYYADPYLAFLISAIITASAAILTIFHPIDLTLKPLDSSEVKEKRSKGDPLELSLQNVMIDNFSSISMSTTQVFIYLNFNINLTRQMKALKKQEKLKCRMKYLKIMNLKAIQWKINLLKVKK